VSLSLPSRMTRGFFSLSASLFAAYLSRPLFEFSSETVTSIIFVSRWEAVDPFPPRAEPLTRSLITIMLPFPLTPPGTSLTLPELWLRTGRIPIVPFLSPISRPLLFFSGVRGKSPPFPLYSDWPDLRSSGLFTFQAFEYPFPFFHPYHPFTPVPPSTHC